MLAWPPRGHWPLPVRQYPAADACPAGAEVLGAAELGPRRKARQEAIGTPNLGAAGLEGAANGETARTGRVASSSARRAGLTTRPHLPASLCGWRRFLVFFSHGGEWRRGRIKNSVAYACSGPPVTPFPIGPGGGASADEWGRDTAARACSTPSQPVPVGFAAGRPGYALGLDKAGILAVIPSTRARTHVHARVM